MADHRHQISGRALESADPLPGCQHDWISPVRVPGRSTGQPLWGRLERLIDGQWVELGPSDPRPTIEVAIRRSRRDGPAPPAAR